MAKNKKKATPTRRRRTAAPRRGAARRRAPATRAPRRTRVAAVPPGYTTVTPHLVCRGAAGAIAFYTRAFNARPRVRMDDPQGRVVHGEFRIGSSIVMIGEETPERGASAPPSIGGTPVTLFLYVPNVDKAFAQATAAGATAEMPPTDMFWGDRYCKVVDPYGHKWSMATHIEDVSPREMGRRAAAEFAKQGA